MSDEPRPPAQPGSVGSGGDSAAGSDRALKSFRYVVGAVNDEALRAWAEIWKELQAELTPPGTEPEAEQGFRPAFGRPELLERFWLLKHYLDYLNRLCK